jgi:hypothetical protein
MELVERFYLFVRREIAAARVVHPRSNVGSFFVG